MRLVVLMTVIVLGFAAMANIRPRKVKPPKPIDWSDPYYNETFGLCKKLRHFNPVEDVRVQVWATDIFRTCGSHVAMKFATRCNFPAFGELISLLLSIVPLLFDVIE